jgi:hypothetical protein
MGGECRDEAERAKAYWLPHILGSLGADGGNSYQMCSMKESIKEMLADGDGE